MNTVFCLIVLAHVILGGKDGPFYKSISTETYNQYPIVDTVYNTGEYIVTKCKDNFQGFESYSTLIKKSNGKCFILDDLAQFENDSTIILYGAPLRADEEGPTHKNGIWFYMEPYRKKVSGNFIFRTDEIGMNYVVDSIPVEAENLQRPTNQGIYLYENGKLVHLTSDQSEEKFSKFRKSGFYFLPNPGIFFKRYSIRDIK